MIIKRAIKSNIKFLLDSICMTEAVKKYYVLCKKDCGFSKDRKKILASAIKNFPNTVFVKSKIENPILREGVLFKEICKKARLKLDSQAPLFYYPDFFILKIVKSDSSIILGNLTINYELILKKGVMNLKKEIEGSSAEVDLKKALIIVCEGIEIYMQRVLSFLNANYPEKKELIDLISKVPLFSANSFKEALQSILIINSLIWMNDHSLVGLGRLDQILYPYYIKDLKDGKLSEEEAEILISSFIETLHKGFKYKSNTLPGDTGQVIVLGGINPNNECDDNELTLLFMKVMKKLKLPDPKIILRIGSKTSECIWREAIDLLSEGLGYPLFSNDDVIIPALIEFGYDNIDVYNYVVSACWEPHIAGVSFDQNNIYTLNFLIPLQNIFKSKEEIVASLKTFNKFLDIYLDELENYVEASLEEIQSIKFRPSPLLSLLTGCSTKDISNGGAKYNHLGFLTVGLSNIVDSLFNIKQSLESRPPISLLEHKKVLADNFGGHEDLLYWFKMSGPKFGDDEENVLNITNILIDHVSRVLQKYKNPFGGKYKLGLSSPTFVESGKQIDASPDGRKKGEPLGVHISFAHKEGDYISLFNFSSQLNYRKAFNGAVTDVVIDSGFLKRNFNNFICLFKTFFLKGGTQLQCNVLDYMTLLKALKNPEAFPNLIVRVWGFSAYFRDLPREYQELVVERARQYEHIAYDN